MHKRMQQRKSDSHTRTKDRQEADDDGVYVAEPGCVGVCKESRIGVQAALVHSRLHRCPVGNASNAVGALNQKAKLQACGVTHRQRQARGIHARGFERGEQRRVVERRG